MKAKELKALLDGVNENADVLFQDVNGMLLEVIHGQASKDGDVECVYLNTRQEFPDAWFRHGAEVHWIGDGVIPVLTEDCNDEILITDKNVFGDENEHEFHLAFYNGFAEGEGLRLEYPRMEDVTDEMIEEMNTYTGGAIADSGSFNQHDVAVKYGKVVSYERPVKRLDRDSCLICESVQEITLTAWPMIYGETNPHDLDSREVLDVFRSWGEEFESWWINHPEEWICEHDYIAEVESFAQKKAAAWLSELTKK